MAERFGAGSGESGSGGARRAGEKLLGEVRLEGFSELLLSLREISGFNDRSQDGYFGIPELDDLLPASTPLVPANEKQQQPPPHPQKGSENDYDDLWHPDSSPSTIHPTRTHQQQPQTQPRRPQATQPNIKRTGGPILELVSPQPTHHWSTSGKTSLIYLISALAVLPATLSSHPLGGHNAAIIIFDPLAHFSVSRLVEVMVALIKQRINTSSSDTNVKISESLAREIKTTIQHALPHIHIFRPHTWETLLSTLHSLPDYLFSNHGQRHKSFSRKIHAVVLEDMDTFYWPLRDSSSAVDTLESVPISNNTNPITQASQTLTTSLLHLSTLLSTAIVVTSHSYSASAYRASIPNSWPAGVRVTRCGVKKVEIVRFGEGFSVEEAERDREKRGEVVRRGRFECWMVGRGNGEGRTEGEGFVFRVGDGEKGVRCEQEEK